MKERTVVALFMLAFALVLSAGLPEALVAQNSTEPAATAPTESKETAPAATEKAPAPPAAPSESKAAAAPNAPAASQKQSHKEFAQMEVKDCGSCHTGEKVAPNHGPFWEREHSIAASKSAKNCADCHGQSFCLDCHTGGGIDAKLDVTNFRSNYVPKSHRTDFREIHPLKALDNPQTCTRCHDARFCSDCHSKFRGEDLMVQSHRRSWSDLQAGNPGPAHSTFPADSCQSCHSTGLSSHLWSADHAREARRNLQACQTCHSDGQVCMTCHSARTGLMMNPHPRNWNSVKDKYRSKSDGRSCIKCHDNF
jgi:hypothetical protein